MFYSKDGLVEIAASSVGIRLENRLTFDVLIKKIVEANQRRHGESSLNDETTAAATPNARDMTISQEIIKAVLERSFMKPLKGAARDYCSMGHKLELPLAKDWMREVNVKGLFPGFKIISLHKVGAVGKKIILGQRIVLIF